jgi:uncharacterized RDD family membrane protein YckC
MAWMGTFALFGVVSAMIFASFVLARLLAGFAFRVADRVAPFGEARASGFERARPGARLAITLAGPLGVYVFLASLCALAFLLGAGKEAGTTIVEVVASGPAAAGGLQAGDRIVSLDGTPVARPADMRPLLTARSEGRVEVVFERDGRQIRMEIVPDSNRRLGVQLGPNPGAVGLGQAIRGGAATPYEVLAGIFSGLFGRVEAELTGPIGVTKVTARPPELGRRLLIVAGSQCVGLIWFFLVSLALWPQRPKDRAAPAPSDAVPLAEGETVAPRPGVRLLARLVDWTLIAIIPSAIAAGLSGVSWLVWFPLEALLISRWGYTPGKWLLGIAVRDAQGARLSFRGAFHRNAALWAYGYGANTLFGFVTAVLAYASLKRNGATYWDALGGYVVRHRRIGAGRATMAAAVLLLGLAAIVAAVAHYMLIRDLVG